MLYRNPMGKKYRIMPAAGEKAEEKAENQTGETAAVENGETGEGESAEGESAEEAEEPDPPSLAGPDAAPETDPETGKVIESVLIEPDAVGTVSYANVERRMRENNLNVLALQESVDFIDGMDYDKMYEDLRRQLNEIAQGQWAMVSGSISSPEYPGVEIPVEWDSYAYAQSQQLYDSLRKQFDAIKDGEMQEDNAGAKRQLKSLQDQIIMGGEMMYASIAGLETQEDAL